MQRVKDDGLSHEKNVCMNVWDSGEIVDLLMYRILIMYKTHCYMFFILKNTFLHFVIKCLYSNLSCVM